MQVQTIGNEGHPVVVIDDFVANPQDLVEFAATQARFDVPSPFYPGPRATAPEAYKSALARAIDQIVRRVFEWRDDDVVTPTESNFSLVTTPPLELHPLQRIPHFDSISRDVVAVLHYLCDASNGGTGFYRHRGTGFESVTVSRRQVYQDALNGDLRAGHWPQSHYLRGSTAQFERHHRVDCAYNRLLIYRGAMLHSGDIPADLALAADPRVGRLTLNTFLERRPA